MAEANQNRFRRFLIALAIGGIVGAIVGTFIKQGGVGRRYSETSPEGAEEKREGTIEQSIAWQYATAYREGNWERVLALTLWAQERLQLVAEEEGEDAAAKERDVLRASFGTRTLVENYLRDTGVEDQYVFAPGSRVSFDSVDEGREDLELPVATRTWLKVTYPAREKALLDRESVPIHSLRVGINISHDGFVLKANIVGNLDIDWTSIKYDWPSP